MDKEKKDNKNNLSNQILNNIKASKDLGLLRCVQCGMCTSMCPAAKHSKYNPRLMVEKVLENDENIIKDENIWNCFYCYTCHSICGVGNSPCEINQILRQIAIDKKQEDKFVNSLSSYGDSFMEIGIGGMPKSFFMQLHEDIDGWLDLKSELEDIRENLDLGPVKMDENSIKEVRKLLKHINFEKRLEKLKSQENKLKTNNSEVKKSKKGETQ
ncbi:MAG: 4Fe-4S dicluster domain-containing protein [Methanobrevibacter sp.]|jgi:heterodisulfide reductase subunit C|nr:4Fe-4S dicluster domain-containing protein [Candidatus Methanoflexus mossambicus]